MTETRRQYRERLAQVSFNAERPITGLRVYTSDEQERHAAIAEDVAAQVLRDILSMFNTENEASDKCNHRRGARAAIRHYAIERGIDLGDKE